MEYETEICAGGLVIKDGKLVVLKRHNGIWLMPKGHLEPGETLEEAALREAHEETGLLVKLGPKLGETAYSHSEDGRLHQKIVHWFYMEAISGDLKPEKPLFTEVALISREQVGRLSFFHDQKLAEKAFIFYEGRQTGENTK